MLAARLKYIFFILLATQIGSVVVSFAFWSYIVLTRMEADPHESIVSLFCLVGGFFAATVACLFLFYKRMVRFSNISRSVTASGIISAEAMFFLLGVLLVTVTLLLGATHSQSLMIGFIATTMVLVAALHLLSCYLLRKLYNHPRNKLNVLVLGMNERTVEFCQILKDTEHIGAEVHGYLDGREMKDAPVRYLGTMDDLDSVLRNQVIDMVAIFLPIRSFYDVIDIILETCGFYGVTSYVVGNVFEAEGIRRVPTSINDFGNMAFSSTTVDYVGLAFKRIFDVVASAVALVVLSPLLAAIAVYIKIVSKGPVFFTQERIGLNKRSFKMVKFRTMIPDAEKYLEELTAMNEMDGAAFKIKDDPRIIPGGSFLRRHSLDELPQLWNVLKGDMSVVGPRPLSRRDYDLLKDDWQRKRFSMRPGLTCTWQVSGRNDVTFVEWMKMDLDYIDQWQFSDDLWLIFKTIKIVFVGSGR